MNDPHVDALHYRISYTDAVDYSDAEVLDFDEVPAFSVRIERGNAKITMNDHFTSVEAAQTVVEPFLRTWELSWALDHPEERFEFKFERGDLVDRNPASKTLFADAGFHPLGGMNVAPSARRSKYPDPPSAMGWDANIDVLFDRYRKLVERRTTLSDAAYFCLTVLEAIPEESARSKKKERKPSPRRKKAAAHFRIDVDVLSKIGELSSTKGGAGARKAEGTQEEFTVKEHGWLESALKTLIRRAAQKVYSSEDWQTITMDELPP